MLLLEMAQTGDPNLLDYAEYMAKADIGPENADQQERYEATLYH